MTTEITAAGVGEMRAASTADGGTALTTTPTFIGILPGSHHIFITPRNFATAVVAKWAINPYIVVLKTTDAMATVTDYTSAANDSDAATVVDVGSLSTLANGDCLIVGSPLPFRGVYVDIAAANTAGTATTSVFYWNGSIWADTSATDGTNSTMTLAVDGLVYWTVPSAWRKAKLNTIYSSCTSGTGTVTSSPVLLTQTIPNVITVSAGGTAIIVIPPGATGIATSGTATITGSPVTLVPGANSVTTGATTGTFIIRYVINSPMAYSELEWYWTRWSVSAALADSTVTFSSMRAANRSTAYAEFASGQKFEERVHYGIGGSACVEALVNDGTGNLIVDCAAPFGGRLS